MEPDVIAVSPPPATAETSLAVPAIPHQAQAAFENWTDQRIDAPLAEAALSAWRPRSSI